MTTEWTHTHTFTFDDLTATVDGQDWRLRAIRAEASLRYALRIIDSYALDCRHLARYLEDNPTGQGFCQGSIYREAERDVRYWGQRAVDEASDA